MAPMGTENKILRVQIHRLPHGRGFLACAQVCRPFVIIGDALIDSLFFNGVQHVLEFTDQQHIMVDPHQAVLAIELQFFIEIAYILIHRNGGNPDGILLP